MGMNTRCLALITGVALVAAPVSSSGAQSAGTTTTGASAAPKPTKAIAKPTPYAVVDTGKVLPIDGIAAVVGDQVVLISEVLAMVNTERARGAKLESAKDLAKLEADVLEQLIDAELLVQKAKAEKVEVQDADVQADVDQTEKRARSNFKTDAEFKQALKESGFGTLEEWKKLQFDMNMRNKLQQGIMQKLQRDGKVSAVNVSEAEITEAFENAKGRLPKKDARIGLRQIVIATRASDAAKKRARDRIDSLRAEIEKHPEDFENLAKRFSMDPGSAEMGGDLGWNRRGRMVPEFDRMMFGINPGIVSPVVETQYGYHIIRVDRVQPAEVKARHILIRPLMDSTDEARTRLLADSVATAWRKGSSFDSLSVRYHDDAGQEEKTIPEFPRDSLPEVYRNALEGKQLNEITDPFPIPDPGSNVRKYVVAQVTMLGEAGEYTLGEYRTRIREQLSEERKMRRLIDTLKKQTYVSVRYEPLKAITP
jgi:peptidyl-prolyl cis-trans isomerase SurA